ncbi:MAG: dual specificity protein phosphatase family protein [bacterium]|nr:dual specificity protein phosphatase family protein [bacterium]
MNKIYWLEEGKIAGRSYPSLEELKELYREGFRILVSLERREDIFEIEKIGFKVFPIFIQDFTSPSIEQLEKFNSIIDESTTKPILVHCTGGLGRTGTMLASYLIKRKSMTAKQAIKFVRLKRDGAVETREQEKTLEIYEKYISGRM